MLEPGALAVFCAAALALLVVPGPSVLYIVAQAIDGGRKAGLVSMLGIQTGGLVHVLAAAVGLSALVASSAVAFDTIKYAGAAYLIVMGLRTLLRRVEPVEAAPPRERPLSHRYGQGVLVNVLNPKTGLFFLAFLPQFVDRGAGHVGLQVLGLGLLFLALAVLSDGAWALAAGTAGSWLRGHRGFLRARRYVSGTVFVGLGVLAALTSPHRASG